MAAKPLGVGWHKFIAGFDARMKSFRLFCLNDLLFKKK